MSPTSDLVFAAIIGGIVVQALNFAWLGYALWRDAWREGTEIQGDAIERNRKREER